LSRTAALQFQSQNSIIIRFSEGDRIVRGNLFYDSAELHEELEERETKPIIPNRNRKRPFGFSKRL
jgi:hypothetical protein